GHGAVPVLLDRTDALTAPVEDPGNDSFLGSLQLFGQTSLAFEDGTKLRGEGKHAGLSILRLTRFEAQPARAVLTAVRARVLRPRARPARDGARAGPLLGTEVPVSPLAREDRQPVR